MARLWASLGAGRLIYLISISGCLHSLANRGICLYTLSGYRRDRLASGSQHCSSGRAIRLSRIGNYTFFIRENVYKGWMDNYYYACIAFLAQRRLVFELFNYRYR